MGAVGQTNGNGKKSRAKSMTQSLPGMDPLTAPLDDLGLPAPQGNQPQAPKTGAAGGTEPKAGGVFEGISSLLTRGYGLYVAEKNRRRAAQGQSPISPGQITGVSEDVERLMIYGGAAAVGLVVIIAVVKN